MKNEKEYELKKELLDEMRNIEGFPLGKDEDIIALSDPPYYTACPNPWIEDFIKEHGKPYDEENDDYHREPFAFDVSEGKNDPIYSAHSYHTKVPHKAIMRYMLHYTEPGDIVLDGFCGTGMAGVAAQMCGNPDPEFKKKIEKEMPHIKWGSRKAILNDLCPSAAFIAYNYNTPIDKKEFEREAKCILDQVEKECGWMYETDHTINGEQQYRKDLNGNKIPTRGKINYVIWSDVFVCPNCSKEIIFWDSAVDKENGKIMDEFKCPNCTAMVNKRSLERAWETGHDDALEKTIKRAKQVPVLINYIVEGNTRKGRQRKYCEKVPDEKDLALVKKIEGIKIPYSFPSYEMMFKGDRWGDTWRAGVHAGITHVHHFYTKRNLWVLATLWEKLRYNKRYLSSLTNCMLLNSRMNRWPRQRGPLAGTLFVPSIGYEYNTILSWKRSKIVSTGLSDRETVIIESCSSSMLENLSNNSIDYVFIDPPFGGNLMYSELNFLWEAWLRVFTNNKNEAIINNAQNKRLTDYQHLMERCFAEYYRVLKPGRWMTVEFHNAMNAVWMAIQEALQRVGFVVADVRTLDKKQGTFKQVPGTGAVKQDLIITTYKPNGGLEKRFKLTAGTEEGVWEFVREHLKHLPVAVEKDDNLEIIAERQNFFLFDRMVAFHVQRGVIVPISAGDFYLGLRQRFPERDGMYFLPEQVVEYDRKRLTAKKVEQLSLTVHDEKSAVQWLRQELDENPQTFQDIQPKFLQNLHKDKYEKLPELLEVLEQNFLKDENGRWRVPDLNKQPDLERLREKALLREFEKYKEGKGRLKEFRTEAVRAGFKKCWSDRDYKIIIEIGKRLPPVILQEDSTLLMYYDNARMRGGNA
ncbi:MAG: DNA methylase [Theionarchaea archaeon]|nr:MAG: DNA methylase [Theionarchaea archaeon DG-70-1]MBU7026771.1 DNA methylase [Theionarchaea archaeon]